MLVNRWAEKIVYAWACQSVANLGELTLRHDGD